MAQSSTAAFWCIRCLRSYSTKQRFNDHFENINIQGDGGYKRKGGRVMPNQCYKAAARGFAKTLKEAEMLQSKVMPVSLFYPVSKRAKTNSIPTCCPPDVELEQDVNLIAAVSEPVQESDFIVMSEPQVPETEPPPVSEHEPQLVAENEPLGDNRARECDPKSCSSLMTFDSELFNKRMDELKVDYEKLNDSLKDLKLELSGNSLDQIDELLREKEYISKSSMDLLINSRSMEEFMTNPLVNGVFDLVRCQNESTRDYEDDFSQEIIESECFLVCVLCEASKSKCGIHINDIKYTCARNQTMANWFSVMKKMVRRHIESDTHKGSSKKFDEKIHKVREEMDNMKRRQRYLVYYLLKTNTAFINFPVLLATAYQCGLEVGDINHTDRFASRILPLIDGVLQENTKTWLEGQEQVSLSLDIGTYMGLVLLVVYYIGQDGSTRLAGCNLTQSKEGLHCAQLCYNIAQSNIFVTEDLIRQKVNAIIADGAFCRGNEPFKAELRRLLRNNDLIFRWDLLHMSNRSHISARGMTRIDLDQLQDDERDAEEERLRNQPVRGPTIAAMMNYVQHESKRWRQGIRYTQLVLETLDFMRPKLFSSTRLCLYEFEQVKRFIEVRHYFDVPWEWEVMSILYCFVMFSEKIMLKKCQKTNDQREYVGRVFLGVGLPEPEGKTAMMLTLRVGSDVIRRNPLRYLDEENFVDIIARDPEVNIFLQDLKKFIRDLGDKLVPDRLDHPNPGRRPITLNAIEAALEAFIDNFWEQFFARTNRTDLTSQDCWSFSEAPCESFFSNWGRIVSSRPSLLVENVIRLIRLQLEGPPAGTDCSHDLMKTAMDQYRTLSHLGERYTTQRWAPGRISSTVRRVTNRQWKYAAYSDFE